MVLYHFSAGESLVTLLAVCITCGYLLFTFFIHCLSAFIHQCYSLQRAGRVCRLWNSAASSPVLWRSVSVGYCWIEPGKSQLPGTEQKIKNTVDWLTQNRSVITVFSLKTSLQIVQSVAKLLALKVMKNIFVIN